jgi:hypothetical protein
MRQTYLSNRVFSDYDDVFDAAESVVLQRDGSADPKKRVI